MTLYIFLRHPFSLDRSLLKHTLVIFLQGVLIFFDIVQIRQKENMVLYTAPHLVLKHCLSRITILIEVPLSTLDQHSSMSCPALRCMVEWATM